MRIANREITDECTHCGNILQCELFRQGHGIHTERTNVLQMIAKAVLEEGKNMRTQTGRNPFEMA